MELIWLDSNLHEIGPCANDIDFDTGVPNKSTNDFLLTGEVPSGVSAVYVPGTEFGGFIELLETNNFDSTIKHKGWTWRGLLTQGIICPADGEDYYTVSGDAHTIMNTLLSDFLGGFFTVPETLSGITITSYQFARYCTILDGLTAMLDSVDAKMKIVASKPSAGSAVAVTLTANPIETIGDKYTTDSPVDITFTDNQMGINHLICLGQGELSARTRVDLYIDATGAITTTQFYTGFDERTAVYDYSSAESTAILTRYGKREIRTLASKKSISLDNANVNGDIGDLVYGHMNGVAATSPIIQKILTISGGIWTFESKIEGVT